MVQLEQDVPGKKPGFLGRSPVHHSIDVDSGVNSRLQTGSHRGRKINQHDAQIGGGLPDELQLASADPRRERGIDELQRLLPNPGRCTAPGFLDTRLSYAAIGNAS